MAPLLRLAGQCHCYYFLPQVAARILARTLDATDAPIEGSSFPVAFAGDAVWGLLDSDPRCPLHFQPLRNELTVRFAAAAAGVTRRAAPCQAASSPP